MLFTFYDITSQSGDLNVLLRFVDSLIRDDFLNKRIAVNVTANRYFFCEKSSLFIIFCKKAGILNTKIIKKQIPCNISISDICKIKLHNKMIPFLKTLGRVIYPYKRDTLHGI